MSNADLDKIREIAQHHRTEPRPEAWNKLNQKLHVKKAKVKMLTYRNISIAAILISILSVSAVFSLYIDKHDPAIFASNEDFRPIILEELDAQVDNPIIEMTDISELMDAYANYRSRPF